MLGVLNDSPFCSCSSLASPRIDSITEMWSRAEALARAHPDSVMGARILVFAAVILLITNLDRPGEGSLRVSQQALSDLQRQLHGGGL